MSYQKIATVMFANSKYDYETIVSGKVPDSQVKAYFKGSVFNLGKYPAESPQLCVECEVLTIH